VHGFGHELTATAELSVALLACTGAVLLWDDRAGETLAGPLCRAGSQHRSAR
jgi:hypothetical protein